MAEEHKTLPYDNTDKESIYNYAIELLGSTLREKSNVEQIDDISRNKGSFGNAVEQFYFYIDNNGISAPDFAEAGVELKTTPLKKNKDGSLSSKERLVIGMIDYMNVVDETFETSHLLEKAKDILLISYLWEPDKEPLDYHIELVEMIDLEDLPEGDLAQIKEDWETVVDKIRAGLAHELSGSDTLYLEACTKAANSSIRRKQPNSNIEAKPRAWALKPSYMTAMSNRLIRNMQAIERDEDERSIPLIELVKNRFAPYFGLTETELAERFGYLQEGRRKPKNLCALITRKILGVSDNAKIEEFEKAGIVPKTIRVKRNGTPKEAMSFPYFDYCELAITPYEDSDFARYIDQKYLFVIYRESDDGEYLLSDVAFWQMPEVDVEDAKKCYEEMRNRVKDGRADESVKSTENRVCHVRPHARDGNDTLMTPQGKSVVKKSFWINQKYLAKEIARVTNRTQE